jgi:hypothetical protein
MQPRTTPQAPTNRAARRAAKRGKAVTDGPSSRVPLRDGRANTTPVHARTDYAARRSG